MEKLRKIETSFGLSVEVGAAELADLTAQGLVKVSKPSGATGGADSAADKAATAADKKGAGA